MRARSHDIANQADAPVRAALSTPGRALSETERAPLEQRLGGDLGRLAVHLGPEVDTAARVLGARGFAVGRHAALSSAAGPDTLAHEAAHALQQDMAEPRGTVPVLPAGAAPEREAQAAAAGRGPVGGGHAPFLGRDLTSPGRLGEVHEAVRVEGPPQTTPTGATTTTRRLAWQDPSTTSGGTAELIENEVIARLSGNVLRPLTAHTTRAELDRDATDVNRMVVTRFPQIPSPLSDADVPDRARMSTPAELRRNQNFLDQWFDNTLRHLSASAGRYAIDTSNDSYRAMRARLFAHSEVGPLLVGLAARQSAFTAGEKTERRVFMHERVPDNERIPTLIHEFIHLYRHTTYQTWVAASMNPRAYNEGITEWLARKVMADNGITGRTRYDEHVATVNQQIAPHVSEDGIARALFRGEVWRLETGSAEARTAFEGQTGIAAGGTREAEVAASRSSGGFFQTVSVGAHYRFINLGVDETQPKAEHVEAFRGVKRERLDPEPARRVRFVGHASGPGTEAHNLSLSRRRSVAFYRMARREGLAWSRLADADRPPHFGEARPSITEEDTDPIARAMNRRVEMFLVDGGGS